MTPADAIRVLAKAAAFDQRTVGQADAMAWAEALGDTPLGDALAAVTRHYASRTERLMPAHVNELARQIDRERRRFERERCEYEQQLALESDPTRRDRSAEVQALIAQLRNALPDANSDVLRRPEVLAWERNRERAARAEPNPHYDPRASVGADGTRPQSANIQEDQ